jgi:hypothetical protein
MLLRKDEVAFQHALRRDGRALDRGEVRRRDGVHAFKEGEGEIELGLVWCEDGSMGGVGICKVEGLVGVGE